MTSDVLFPYRYKRIGMYIFLMGIVLGIWYLINQEGPPFLNWRVPALWFEGLDLSGAVFFGRITDNVLDELALILIIAGGILIGFSRCRDEDEYIRKLRSDSLIWAFYVNYGILAASIIFVYGLSFLWIMTFNMLTPLLFFLFRFYYLLYREKKSMYPDEK